MKIIQLSLKDTNKTMRMYDPNMTTKSIKLFPWPLEGKMPRGVGQW